MASRLLPFAFLSAALAVPTAAQHSLPGTWSGTLRTGLVELRVVLHIARDGDAFEATLDSPDQGTEGLGIDEITFADGRLRFSMARLRASFDGEIDDSGDRIEGTWSQNGELPLTFVRQAEGEVAKAPARPQHPKAPFPYRAEEVVYSFAPGQGVAASFAPEAAGDDDARIGFGATLTLPERKGPHPAVVLITGSGPQDRDETLLGHKPFLVIADHLTRNGIAVLRYDDRGVGASTGDFASATTADFAQDALAGVHYLWTRSEVAPDRIGLVGHSEGGLIAPIVAADPTNRIALLVLLAGPGVNGRDILEVQNRLISEAAGTSADEIDRDQKLLLKFLDINIAESDAEVAKRRLREAALEEWNKLSEDEQAAIGDRDTFLDGRVARLASPWFRYFLTYDPRPTLAKVRCPVLALNGERDLQVDPGQNLRAVGAALLRGGNPDFALMKLPGLNHLFQPCETGSPSEYGKIETTFAPLALDAMSHWIAARFR